MGTPHEALDTDWQRSAGNFQCLSCKSKRLPAAAFSKAQLGKAQKHPDLAATCKACTQASEAAKQPESTERDGASGAVAADGKHLCSACKVKLYSQPPSTHVFPSMGSCKCNESEVNV
jgi:hypothetical protein